MPEKNTFPLLPQQERLLPYELRRQTRGAQNAGNAYRLRGPADHGRLTAVLNRLSENHDALRTRLRMEENGPVKHEVLDTAPAWRLHEPREYQGEEGFQAAYGAAKRVMEEPMDLFAEPLFSFHLFPIGHEDVLLVVKASHLLTDGPSFAVLYAELAALYADLDFRWPVRPLNWEAFVQTERDYAASPKGHDGKEYWKQQSLMGNFIPTAQKIAAATGSGRTGLEQEKTGRLSLDRLRSIARRERTSVFHVTLFLYAAALGSLFQHPAFPVGYTLTNRFEERTRYMVGLSTHNVRENFDFTGNRTCREILGDSRRSIQLAFQHFIMGESAELPLFQLSYLSEITKSPQWHTLRAEAFPLAGAFRYGDFSYNLMCSEKGRELELSACADPAMYPELFHRMLFFRMETAAGNFAQDGMATMTTLFDEREYQHES